MFKNLLAASLLAFASFGCHRTIYSPNPQASPLLAKQNDTELNGGLSFAYPFSEFTISVAHSPINHLGLFANARGPLGKLQENDQTGYCCHDNRNGFEGGLGYYNRFANGLFIQVYGGGGRSNIDQAYQLKSPTLFGPGTDTLIGFTGRVARGYINPTVGFSTKMAHAYASFGFAGIKLTDLNIRNGANSRVFNNIKNGQRSFLFEPSVGLLLGREKVRYLASICLSNGYNFVTDHSYGHVSIQQSVTFRFGNGLWEPKLKPATR